jgi:hypothetical protein
VAIRIAACEVMAIAKKNSRGITVNGQKYRWMFHEDSGYNTVTVQSDIGRGCKLVANIAWYDFKDLIFDDSGSLQGEAYDRVTPSFVAYVIRCAIDLGWVPYASGKAFQVKYEKDVFCLL